MNDDDLKVYDDATGLRIMGYPGDILRLDKSMTNALCYGGHYDACPQHVRSKYGPLCVCLCHDEATTSAG